MAQKNTAGKWIVFAWTTADGLPKTGDAANITANVRIDGGAANAVDDTNPTELEDGYYIFDITAAEFNGDNILICPASSTSGVQVIGVPGALWTRPANFPLLSIDANGKVLLQATQTGVTIPTVTDLTNLPAITSNWLTAAGIAASALNGKGDWNVGKTGYSLTATTGLGNQTADITGNLSGSVGSVTGAVGSVTGAVGSVTAGVTLANGAHGGAAATMQLGGAGGLTSNITGNLSGSVGSVTGAVGSVTGAVGSVTGNVGGNVTGSVGSVTSGVTVTTNNDKTGYTLSAAGVQAIWDALTSALTTVGSIGKRIVDYLTGDIYARIGAPVGASISADIAGIQSDTNDIQTRLPAALVSGRMDSSVGEMAANTLTASALATDAVTEIQSGLATSAVDIMRILDRIEFNRGHHTVTGSTFYVDGISGNDTTGTGSRLLPYKTISKAVSVAVDNRHDEIILLPNLSGGPTTITESATISISGKDYLQIRGPGRDVNVTLSTSGNVFDIRSSGVELSGFRITTNSGASSAGVEISNGVDFVSLYRLWIESAHRDAIRLNVANRCIVNHCVIVGAARDGVRIDSGAGAGTYNQVVDCVIRDSSGSAVNLQGSDASDCRIQRNTIRDNAVGITVASGVTDTVITDNRMINNTTTISDAGTRTLQAWNFLSTDTAGLLAWNAVWDAEVQSEAADALNAYDPPTKTELDAAVAPLATAASIAALNNLSAAQVNAEVDTALSDVGLTTTVTGRIDAAVSSRLATAGYTAPDNASIASILTDTGTDIPAQISGLNNLSSAQAQTAATAALNAYDPPTHAEMTSELATADDATLAAIAALNNLSQANVRTAVGLASANLDTQLDAIPTAAENATAVLSAADTTPIDANIKKVNDVTVVGNGDTTPWGPA